MACLGENYSHHSTKKPVLLNTTVIFKKFQWEPGNCEAARLPSIKGKLLERIIKPWNKRAQDKSGVMGDSTGLLRGRLRGTNLECSWRSPAIVYTRSSGPWSALGPPEELSQKGS